MATIFGLRNLKAGPDRVDITSAAIMKGSGEGKTIEPEVGFPLTFKLSIAVAMDSHQSRMVGSFLSECMSSIVGDGLYVKLGVVAEDDLQPNVGRSQRRVVEAPHFGIHDIKSIYQIVPPEMNSPRVV